ncbi:1-(5-phosphoribosyl)-5-[(5-phosphoribosylamino)methylideneamino]imidazole-4-carboxamide isomerase [Stygiobacter electus]|uniref:1-(5-phosphoribosyl)-5-[(5-phosphoribosylamino)methylideneamino] imidazole-4-carboxamide isomerase n=1 Tax=Stygiobacter electus TaxID=3032292 RepID=A0AAE3TBD0_9BACT|nr:1-(5-phosphoribosyl)-5-[(5-phosphoribosylamino)methylideneamino]imidazole-4-carboxamide isomerase [Stygiobacter electus]MDF1610680.1 1-(5-phosphoribosyl)-5-[(5-phosphoribosylamino)methylideneamino]imidazole-4-carboxamide isomerase [Stygiobacter electus]
MLVIPAIDIYKNKTARLFKGKFDEAKFYDNSPLEYAKIFSENNFKLIHIVDLEASVNGIISTKEIIKQIKNETSLKIQFGGGIKKLETAKELIDLGVDKIVIGSISISDKDEFEKIVNEIEIEKIIVATDSKDKKILIKGWLEESKIELEQHVNYCSSLGIKFFLTTDITKDGTLTGPNYNLYQDLIKNFPSLNFIASGGISNIDDVIKLNETNLYATVVGKAIYENKINLKELSKIDSEKNNSLS